MHRSPLDRLTLPNIPVNGYDDAFAAALRSIEFFDDYMAGADVPAAWYDYDQIAPLEGMYFGPYYYYGPATGEYVTHVGTERYENKGGDRYWDSATGMYVYGAY